MSQLKTLKSASIGQPDIEDLKLLSVKISNKKANGEGELLGTGTILCNGVDFYVMSAAHCFKDKEGNQRCQKEDIELTLYDGEDNPKTLIVRGLELSDESIDTAILLIDPPPNSSEYFEKLKLIGEEINGYKVYVFGYTLKRSTGRLFTYIRVNTHTLSNQDRITEKGQDFYKTVKGSSGGGVFIGINDQIYCMGFVRCSFDDQSDMDDVKIQPVNSFKNNWGSAWFATIDEALGNPINKPNAYSINGTIQKQCYDLWNEVYVAISKNDNLDSLLTRIKEVRDALITPKSVITQDEVLTLLFRQRYPWPEDYQEAFLMALEDKGMWLSLYGKDFLDENKSIQDRPLAMKLEQRAVTLTRAPFYDGSVMDLDDKRNYYEQILRYAFALDFSSMKKLVCQWSVTGFWTARKALLINLFEKNEDALNALHQYLIDNKEEVNNEQFIATVVYNVANGIFTNQKPYERFLNEGFDGITNILSYIADRIEKKQEKVRVYGQHQRYIFGGEETKSWTEALRLLKTIIEAGVLPNFRFTSLVSTTDWLKVVKMLFRFMPYPILFYSLMYSDEKLLKRIGQEYAYSDDSDIINCLPDIQRRLLNAIGNNDTPRIFIGLYLISSELYVALNEEIWYELFLKNVLLFFCKDEVLRNVSLEDPIFINVKEGIRFLKDKNRRLEVFGHLASSISSNPRLVGILVYNYLLVDDDLMKCQEFIKELKDVIVKHPLKETYMIVGRFGNQDAVDEELRKTIEDVLKKDSLDFGPQTNEAIRVLSYVVRDDDTKVKMRTKLLKNNMWDCGIVEQHYTDPHPIGLEKVDKGIGWTIDEWSLIKENMRNNISLIEQDNPHAPDMQVHFNRQYISLLSEMKRFIMRLKNTGDYEVEDIDATIESLLRKLRKNRDICFSLSSRDYDDVVDGVCSLGDRFISQGLDSCKDEIALLIHRCLIQEPAALDHCLSLLASLVENAPKEMIASFGAQLLVLLKRYEQDFDYEVLNLDVHAVYSWMKTISKQLAVKYGEEEVLNYWLDDKKVNRFNYME